MKFVKKNIFTVVGIVVLLFLVSLLKAQMVDYQRQLDSVFSVVGKQYDSISKKVIIWNKSWEDPNNNRLKLLQVLKWKYTEKAEPSLVISDAISQIVVIDRIESSVYVYDIKSSDLSLKARSTPFILELSKKARNSDKSFFMYFFDKDKVFYLIISTITKYCKNKKHL